MPTLLVVDDEPNILFTIEHTFKRPGLQIVCAESGNAAIRLVREHAPDVVLMDVRLPDISGLDAFQQIQAIDARIPVIIMTAFAKTETAIEAMRRGAFEYFVKPVDLGKLRSTLDRALETSRLSHVPALLGEEGLEEDSANVDRIVGMSPPMQEVYKLIGRVAPQDVTVLIQGESGTGKELVARALYQYSRRSEKPFLAVNCAALPEALLESELFGHERGAFTGADKRHIGKFEQVNGGTIFLDEIGDMTLATQAKALRLLQQQQFERVGGSETIQTNVRIIAATNKDLADMAGAGQFRQDLFYRLNGVTISLPPLRVRRTDIPLLVEHFIRRFNGELNKHVHTISPECETVLLSHTWPGNIRELQSAIRFAMLQTIGDVIELESLPRFGSSEANHKTSVAASQRTVESLGPGKSALESKSILDLVSQFAEDGDADVYRRIVAEVDRIVIPEALRLMDQNQQRAAELLGLSRMTLRAKMRALQED